MGSDASLNLLPAGTGQGQLPIDFQKFGVIELSPYEGILGDGGLKAWHGLICVALLTAGCSKQGETPAPQPPPSADTTVSVLPPPQSDSLPVEDSLPEVSIPKGDRLEVASRAPLTAFPGRPYVYKPAFTLPGNYQVRILKGPDSMKAEKGTVTWVPPKEGRFPVLLEISGKSGTTKESMKAQQGFTVTVKRVLNLSLRPLAAQINKGDTVVFDVKASAYPAWALSSLFIKYDYEGDGHWDTEDLPLAENLLHRKAYSQPGNFSPKVEARYRNLETASAAGKVAVVSAVTAAFILSPDTAEPGGVLAVDLSASKGDGKLAFRLDLNGDGNAEWEGSGESGGPKLTLKAPASGRYQALLTARNSMGQEGSAIRSLLCNARPGLEIKAKFPKAHMAALVEIAVRTRDADDTLRQVKIDYTGDGNAWETLARPGEAGAGPHEWNLSLKHVYGKVGKFTPAVCVTASDGREACGKAMVEIFNAPPECKPGADVRATLGLPLEIIGDGVDPDGKIVKWEWDIGGDGRFELASRDNGKFQYTFSKLGTFPLVLKVTTADGMTATGRKKVEVRKKWKS